MGEKTASGSSSRDHFWWTNNITYLAGIDEVGMGCLAGPVVACAVILSPDNIPDGIRDSKMLTPKRRTEIAAAIKRSAICYQIAWASVEEIDQVNIYQAARLAMKRAVLGLSVAPQRLLIDGRARVDVPIDQESLIKGDQKSVSIGAASILAKVYRDEWMRDLDGQYPGWGFAEHKGYGSLYHRQQLATLGQSPIHRKSFSWTPVENSSLT